MAKETYTKDQLKQLATEAARKHGIDPVFYTAQIEQESGWNPNARSKAGARGLAQFMPDTAKTFGLNPLDPVASLDAGAKYMAQLKQKFGDEDTARLAYNWGEGNVASYLKTGMGNKGRALPKEAEEYNKKIYARAGATKDWGTESRLAVAAPPDTQAVGVMGKPMSTKQAATLAMAEMNQGLPAGTLGQPEPPMAASQPLSLGAVPSMAAAPQGDWRQQLAQMSTGQELKPLASMEDQETMFGKMQDEAVQAQNRSLGKMFADMGAAQRDDGPSLPSSVDRYLDKLLS
jgi:hypothetical protein